MSNKITMFTDIVMQDFNEDLAVKLLPYCKQMISQCGYDKDYEFGLTTYGQNKAELRDHTKWDPAFDELKEWIIEKGTEFIKEHGFEFRKEKGFVLKIRSMWVSQMFVGGHHENHQHLGHKDHLSGNFYVNVPQGSGDLIFKRFDFDYDTWKQLPKLRGEYIPENTLRYEFFPHMGENLIWKSSLIHGVRGNRNDSRIAISYNLEISNIYNNRDAWPSAIMQDPAASLTKNET